jgi:mannosylglycerate hydrolase
VPVQLVSAEDSQPVLEQLVDRPMYFAMRTHRCWLRPAAVPPHGYEVLRVLETGGVAGSGEAIGSGGPGLPSLDNGLVRVAFAENGTFAVEDRQSGRTFRGLGLLLDEGEAGHAWVHSPVGPVVTTARARPSVSLVENGPLAATCEVRHVLRLPADLAQRRLGKTGRRVKLPVTLRACLKAGARRVELSLEVDNTAESHRLRLVFPTGLNAAHSHGEGQFDVVARPVARPDTSGWLEQPMADYPLHHFVDLSDGEAGAAVLVDGLKEYEVLDDGQGTLLLTLLRGFEYVIHPASRQDYSHLKGSQCLGRHAFRLAFLPHRGGWHQGHVYHEALEFNNPVRLAQFGAPSGDAPPAASYLELEPPSLIFSCFKRAEDAGRDAFVLRLYNPGDEPVSGRVRTLRPLARADQVTLEETDPRPLALLDARTFGLELGPRKLGTYRLEFCH